MADEARETSGITLVLADDHPVMRAGTRLHLQAERAVRIVGEADDGQAAFDLIAQHRPDVALVDVRMPLIGGLALLQLVRDHGFQTRMIILSAADEVHLVEKALHLGAYGYVSKFSAVQQIHRAVRTVAAGGRYVDPALLAGLLHEDRNRLTARERDVLQLAGDGLQNKEIARALGLGVETVKSHLSSAMHKLQAQCRTGAVATAIRQAIIE